jgi:hypothetical protein
MSRRGPRGLLHKPFDNRIKLHLLIVFPNNVAEQEKYYLCNVLKKPQRAGLHQFVQRVEQINASRVKGSRQSQMLKVGKNLLTMIQHVVLLQQNGDQY